MNRLASLAFALVIAVTAIGANADLEKLPAEVQSRVAAYLAEKKKTHGAGVDELRPTKIEERKQQGLIRIQYEQYHNGVKVFGSYARITVNNGQPAGRVEVVNDLDVATTPSITLEAAIAIAARQLLISGTPLPTGVGGATREADLLVWIFLISSDDEPQTVKAHRAWINAVSGEIVGLLPNAPHGKPTYHGPLQWHPYWWPSGYNMNTPATFCNGGKCKTFAYHFDDFYATDPKTISSNAASPCAIRCSTPTRASSATVRQARRITRRLWPTPTSRCG